MKLPWAKKFPIFYTILLSLVAISASISASSFPVTAQIKPDATLPHNSLSTQLGNVLQIDGGTRAGNNLFHSFTQFNVPTGGTAFFNNALDVNNIFSRVTGGSASSIDGILKANGTASLFLLNPNGIIFGQNAQLNIGGSFVATTANAIGFGNLGIFSASSPNNPAVLTVNPSAFLFNQIATQPISVKSINIQNQDSNGEYIDLLHGLAVNPFQSILLLGGNVSLDGAVLRAPGGRVELGGLAGTGTVGLNVDGTNLVLTFPLEVPRGDVSLSNITDVYVRAGGGGSIAVNSHNLNMTGGSLLRGGIASFSGHVGSQGGDIDINATGTINLKEGSEISSSVRSGAVGDLGNVKITANSIMIDGVIDGYNSAVFNGVIPGGVGKGGNIDINSNSVSLTNGGQIDASTSGQGNAGSVKITASDSIKIDGVSRDYGYSSGILTGAYAGSQGNGGNINITSPLLSITNGGVLSSLTFNAYKGGNIIVNVNNLELKGGGEILTTTYNSGSAGDINFNVKNDITISNSNPDFFALLATFGRDIVENNLAGVDTFSEKSGIFANTDVNSSGLGGSININTRFLNIDLGAKISVSNRGIGNAGNVNILQAHAINLDGSASITANTTSGAGGNLTLKTNSLQLRHNSLISATAGNNGNGGNLNITANTITALENSPIVANANQGRGGNIQITTQGIFTSPDSPITASSGNPQLNGVVNITALEFSATNSLTQFNGNSIAIQQTIAHSCLTSRNQQYGKFTVTNLDTLPVTPYSDNDIWYALPMQPTKTTSQQKPSTLVPVATQSKPWKIGDPIVEAQSLVRAPDGKVLLSATPQNATVKSANSLVCHPGEDKPKS